MQLPAGICLTRYDRRGGKTPLWTKKLHVQKLHQVHRVGKKPKKYWSPSLQFITYRKSVSKNHDQKLVLAKHVSCNNRSLLIINYNQSLMSQILECHLKRNLGFSRFSGLSKIVPSINYLHKVTDTTASILNWNWIENELKTVFLPEALLYFLVTFPHKHFMLLGFATQ